MAKYTVARVCEKLVAVRSGLAQGHTAPQACKAAGLSTSTYKKWLDTWKDLDLPDWVAASAEHGVVALSGDGRCLFTADPSPDGYVLRCCDAATGTEIATATHAVGGDRNVWHAVIVASADDTGDRLRFVVNSGAMFTWELANSGVTACAHDLQRGCVQLGGRAGSGPRRWASAAFSPDLALVAFWETFGDNAAAEPARLCVRRVDDGSVVMRHETGPLFIASEVVFHPTRAWLAVLDQNKLLTVLDLDARQPLLADGPQVHHVSFGPADTLLYDDWYGRTQELDLTTHRSRVLCEQWGGIASQGDRYVTVSEKAVDVRSASADGVQRHIHLDGITECLLSRDGARLVVVGDRLCVWNLDQPAAGIGLTPGASKRKPAPDDTTADTDNKGRRRTAATGR